MLARLCSAFDGDRFASRQLNLVDDSPRRRVAVWLLRREGVVCDPGVNLSPADAKREARLTVVLVEVADDDGVAARGALENKRRSAWAPARSRWCRR